MKYGFIGCGNMGGAVAKALSRATKSIYVSDRSGKARILAEELGIEYSTNEIIAAECERIFIAVKPHMVEDTLKPLRPMLEEKKPLLVSMAAGIEIKKIEKYAGTKLPVIRIMPNTPTAVSKGIVAYCCNELVDEKLLNDWLSDMRFCGLVDPIEERLMDAVSALSGSGPAYMYMMIEALAEGAVTCGIPWDKAMAYAAMTMSGSAEMYLETRQHPAALKDAVCSPGGSTIVGLRKLEKNGFRAALMDCLISVYKKNKELG